MFLILLVIKQHCTTTTTKSQLVATTHMPKSNLQCIWLCEIRGGPNAKGDNQVEHLSGNMAQGQITDRNLLPKGIIYVSDHRAGCPCQLL